MSEENIKEAIQFLAGVLLEHYQYKQLCPETLDGLKLIAKGVI